MREGPRPGRWQRRMALALGGLGGGVLLAVLVGFLRLMSSGAAPGFTAGGAATVTERCSRGVPAELAQACIEESDRQAAATARSLGLAVAFGAVLFVLSMRIGRSAGRPNHRRAG